jgi:uncharacterized protein YndB with AHSA1/START domain
MKSIRRQRVYPHPPDRVWTCLIDPRILATWLMPTENFEPIVGQRFRFRTKPAPGFDGIIHCTVLEAERPRRLVYTFGSGKKGIQFPTTVAWTLEQTRDGTRLTLEHSGFRGVGGFLLRSMMSNGWGKKLTRYMDVVLDRLEASGDDVDTTDLATLTNRNVPATTGTPR